MWDLRLRPHGSDDCRRHSAMAYTASFTESALQDVLAAAVQPSDPSVLLQVDAQLSEWETEAAYWEALLDAALSQRIDTAHVAAHVATQTTSLMRQFAMIRFKNGISKFWRTRVVNRKSVVIDNERKERIRKRLLDVLHEPDRSVAVQGAVAIARIARTDCPNDWPSLMPTLQATIQSAATTIHEAALHGTLAETARETMILLHATDTLRQCLKEFERVRVLAGKMRMTELASVLMPTLQPVLEQFFADTMGASTVPDINAWAHTPGAAERVRASHLLLKVLHRLAMCDTGILASRVSEVTRPNLAYTFFSCTPRQVSCLAERRAAMLGVVHDVPLLSHALTKHMMAYAKLHLALVARLHSHVSSWPVWSEVMMWYWGVLSDAAQNGGARAALSRDDDDELAVYPYRWLVLTLSLLQTTLGHWKRERPAGTMFVGDSGAQFELQLVDVLLKTYLRMTPADLERWQASPELFAVEEDQADSELDIRPAAECLLAALARWSYRSGKSAASSFPTVAEYVWAQFEASASWPSTLDGIIARDAVYTAVARCRDQLDPSMLEAADEDAQQNTCMTVAIHERLIPEAATRDAGPAWLILRRRIAWMLWEWSEYVTKPVRSGAYALLVQLLQQAPGYSDAAVHLAAARTVAALADTLDFDEMEFLPFLQDALAALVYALSHELEEIDSIRTMANALTVVIERMGLHIQPYAAMLAELVTTLWARDDPEARAKPSLLEFLSKLVDTCAPGMDGDLLVRMHALIAHVVQASLAPAYAPLLGQDALLLWAHTMQATPRMTPALMELLCMAPELVAQPDFGSLMCRTWEDYVLLVPNEILHHFGLAFYGALAPIVADPTSSIILAPLCAVRTHIRTLDAAGLCTLAEQLHVTGLGRAIIDTLYRDETSAVVQACILLISQLAIKMPAPHFHELVRACAPKEPPVWPTVCTCMIKKGQDMALTRYRKLVALGLASMLKGSSSSSISADGSMAPHPDASLLTCIPRIIGLWTEVLGEVVEDDSGNSTVYKREPSPDRPLDAMQDDFIHMDQCVGEATWQESMSPGAERLEAFRTQDPAFTVPIRAFLADTLNKVLQANPANTPQGLELHQQLQQMDPLVLDMLQRDLNQPAANTQNPA